MDDPFTRVFMIDDPPSHKCMKFKLLITLESLSPYRNFHFFVVFFSQFVVFFSEKNKIATKIAQRYIFPHFSRSLLLYTSKILDFIPSWIMKTFVKMSSIPKKKKIENEGDSFVFLDSVNLVSFNIYLFIYQN